ncbi:MAG: hypothetical protein GF393_08515 [Armatimonadia bacterium]|nr:hypothetical protein [Armatimonadia bacterium]
MTPERAAELIAPVAASHILESESTLYFAFSADGDIVYANAGASSLIRRSDDVPSTPNLSDVLPASNIASLDEMLDDGDDVVDCTLNVFSPGHECETLQCRVWRSEGLTLVLGEREAEDSARLQRELMDLNNEFVVKSRELTRRQRELEHARAKLQGALDELETSYWHLRKLQEVLPICMECGKVKRADSTWENVVDYLQRNALFLSHGYCPDCAGAMMDQYGIAEESADDASEPG